MANVITIKPNNDMLNSIIFSIKPFYSELILSKTKSYEYRNFKPKNYSSYFWVYESSPTKTLKYIMKIKEPIVFPNKAKGSSYGVDRFNSGEMQNKYAYEIEELYLIEEPLPMNFLKEIFNFTPPQAYTYLQNNLKLQKYIQNNVNLILI